MTRHERKRIKAIIKVIARLENKRPREIRKAMQEALDAGWAAAWQPGNLYAQLRWQESFPGGAKPSLEEFITQIAKEARELEL